MACSASNWRAVAEKVVFWLKFAGRPADYRLMLKRNTLLSAPTRGTRFGSQGWKAATTAPHPVPRTSSAMGQAAKVHRRGWRRTLTWVAFGLVGLMIGEIWAVGIATSTTTFDTSGGTVAPQVLGTPPAWEYAGLVTARSPLTIGFQGKWGEIDDDTPMFNVDLSGQSGTFATTVYLTNNPPGWSALQLEFRQANKACSDPTLSSSDWASPVASSVMVVESADADATFTSLAAGGQYCIGIGAIVPANDPSGSFIRRPSASSTPAAPSFVAILSPVVLADGSAGFGG